MSAWLEAQVRYLKSIQPTQEKIMTREEAIKIANSYGPVGNKNTIDLLVDLGVLKLEKPKSVREQASEVLIGIGYSNYVIDILEKKGFRIVKE